jgi:hypothetical protein
MGNSDFRERFESRMVERLANPDAVLSRTDLRTLGYERRAVDAIFRSCPVISIPGYSRPLIKAADFERFLTEHTYSNDAPRVRS